MAKEPDESNRPQPILIDSGTPALEIEASENDATVRHDPLQPKARYDLAQAIDRYEHLKSNSDPGNSLAVIGLVVMVVSLFIGVSAAIDGLFNGGSGEGVTLCFGGLFVGALVCVGGVTHSASYQEHVKKALAEIRVLAGLPHKKATPSYVQPGIIMWALGLLLFILNAGIVAFILFLGGLVLLLFASLNGSKSEKAEHVLAAAREVLRQNE